MKLFRKAGALHQHLSGLRQLNATIGFVPTMGALHHGHLQLITQSRKSNAVTVCSIFVNPTQFNNATDFEKYPKTLADDIGLLEAAGTEILFIPEVAEIYPEGTANLEKFDLDYLETILEGSSRPGHFQGVCQVMKRLLTIVEPHMLFMGQKDYQQCMVVKRLITLMGSAAKLITSPTVRQPDGVAMSSRNRRLSTAGLKIAVEIYRTMHFVKEQLRPVVVVKEQLRPGNLAALKTAAAEKLTAAGFTVDYVEIAAADDLGPVNDWDGKTSLVCLVAAFLEEVRLIDNMMIS